MESAEVRTPMVKSAQRTPTAPVVGAKERPLCLVAERAKVKSVMVDMHSKKLWGGITIPVQADKADVEPAEVRTPMAKSARRTLTAPVAGVKEYPLWFVAERANLRPMITKSAIEIY